MSLPINISKTAMKAFQTGMDNIANNIANVNTNSYKAKNVNFQELLVNNQTENQKLLFSEGFGDLAISTGVASSNVSGMDLSQGSLVESAGDFHLAISERASSKSMMRMEMSYTRGMAHSNWDRMAW